MKSLNAGLWLFKGQLALLIGPQKLSYLFWEQKNEGSWAIFRLTPICVKKTNKKAPHKKVTKPKTSKQAKTPPRLWWWVRSLPRVLPQPADRQSCRRPHVVQEGMATLLGLVLGTTSYSPFVFWYIASMFRLPQSFTASKYRHIMPEHFHTVPHIHRQWLKPCPAKVSGNICHELRCRQDFPSGHAPPPGCVSMWVYVYIQKLYSTTHLEKGIFSL